MTDKNKLSNVPCGNDFVSVLDSRAQAPMKPDCIALIEFSSNSVNLTIEDGNGKRESATQRSSLGQFQAGTARLDPAKVAEVFDFFEQKKDVLAQIPLENIRAIGTGSLRDAEDAGAFIDSIEKEFGFKIEVLTGWEEAYNSAHGVQSSFPNAQGIVWDLGGRSSELAVIDEHGKINHCVSLPLGALAVKEQGSVEQQGVYIQSHLESLPDAYQDPCKNLYVTGGNPRRVVAHSLGEDGYSAAHGKNNTMDNVKSYMQVLADNPENMLDDETFKGLYPCSGAVFSQLLDIVDVKNVVAVNSATREGLLVSLRERVEAAANESAFDADMSEKIQHD